MKLIIFCFVSLFLFSCGEDGKLFFKPSKLVISSTNDSIQNEIVGYRRNSNGKLDSLFTLSTFGKGINGPLRSQNSMLWTKEGKFLLVCNAGSNDVSVFKIDGENVTFLNKYSSGGQTPVSITQYKDFIYVLNSGHHGILSGFKITQDGTLNPIPGINIEVDTMVSGPAQASFTCDGSGIIITCRSSNKIIGFQMSKDGIPVGKTSISSNTEVPYGFDLDEDGKIFVTEAKQSGISVYQWKNGKELEKLFDLSKDLHTAACWIKLTKDRKYAFVADADPKNIAGFQIAKTGQCTLIKSDGKSSSTENTPTELTIVDDQFLYVSSIRNSAIEVYQIDGSGNLIKIQKLDGKGSYSWGIVGN